MPGGQIVTTIQVEGAPEWKSQGAAFQSTTATHSPLMKATHRARPISADACAAKDAWHETLQL